MNQLCDIIQYSVVTVERVRSVVDCGPRQCDTITHGSITIDGGGLCINIVTGCKRLIMLQLNVF